MYHEVHNLSRLGFSQSKIARYLVIDIRTVSRYLNMTENDFEKHLINLSQRKKILSPYESFVCERLKEYPDTSSAQMHDWLKEHHEGFPEVPPRTVYNFVMFIRQKYNIPYTKIVREYFPVVDLPYGQQAQVDFGQYNMRLSTGKYKKVYFFVMVLSCSRMKYLLFSDIPFTSYTVIHAHEKAFEFFNGIPYIIVYDQDRILIVDENLGKIILTAMFSEYTKTRNFQLHFCRKSDPESKGKVENVVQYIKKNFLYNRTYHDIETLNTQVIAWLGRTANHLPHNSTKKSPEEDFLIERQHLNQYLPLNIINTEPMNIYHVRKTNVIAYKGNFYSLPMGTYQGDKTQVMLKQDKQTIYIYDLKDNLICSHTLSLEKGKTIINTNHKRDTSVSLDKMVEQTTGYFTDKSLVNKYLKEIRIRWPRYIRDHLQVMIKALSKTDNIDICDKTLDYCIENHIYHGNEFEQVLEVLNSENIQRPKTQIAIKLLDNTVIEKIPQKPQISNIEDYENIFNN